MTQEEKLEEAKRLYKTANADQKYVLESLFPALKESEDERYKSAIRKMYSFLPNKQKYIGDVSVEDMFAWLEKQGKHARFIETIQVGDQVTKNEDGVLVNLSQLKRVAKPSEQKQGEQKPTIEMITPEESLGIDSETYSKIVDECIYGEQKPAEWSEEDEQLYNDLSDTYFYNDEDYPEETYKLMLKRVLDWMNKRAKFLRPQSTWKPSDEQMDSIKYAIDYLSRDTKTVRKYLMSLYEDLKKLREE